MSFYPYSPSSDEPEVDMSWMDEAACRGGDIERFVPLNGYLSSAQEVAAKAICAECVVQEACLDYALEHNQRPGVWGNKTERERRDLHDLVELKRSLSQ